MLVTCSMTFCWTDGRRMAPQLVTIICTQVTFCFEILHVGISSIQCTSLNVASGDPRRYGQPGGSGCSGVMPLVHSSRLLHRACSTSLSSGPGLTDAASTFLKHVSRLQRSSLISVVTLIRRRHPSPNGVLEPAWRRGL